MFRESTFHHYHTESRELGGKKSEKKQEKFACPDDQGSSVSGC
jgi:hypothetical protein